MGLRYMLAIWPACYNAGFGPTRRMLTHKLCRMAYPRLNPSLILRARAEAASLQEAALVIMHDW